MFLIDFLFKDATGLNIWPEKFKLKDIYISFFNSNFNKYLLQ